MRAGAGMWVPAPHSYVETLLPSAWHLGGEPLGGDQVVRVEPPMVGSVSLSGETGESLLPLFQPTLGSLSSGATPARTFPSSLQNRENKLQSKPRSEALSRPPQVTDAGVVITLSTSSNVCSLRSAGSNGQETPQADSRSCLAGEGRGPLERPSLHQPTSSRQEAQTLASISQLLRLGTESCGFWCQNVFSYLISFPPF